MKASGTVLLEFHPKLNSIGNDKELCNGLSAVVQIGDTLWVANDEAISLERLTLTRGKDRGVDAYGREHQRFSLGDYLRLPVESNDSNDQHEVDIEGLDYADGYLWLVGSHSLTRKKPKLKDGAKQAQEQLGQVSRGGNRYLLARFPLVQTDGTYILSRSATQNGKARTAGQLSGDDQGNELTNALRDDEHLRPFFEVPGKDNGFDIEGLAVAGKRLFLGLRGPVLRGWAVILEIEFKPDKKHSSTLELKAIGRKDRLYRKHFLHLGGLGIRDLCVSGSDLLILAGPTMSLEGPVTVFRWRGGTDPKGECMVPASDLDRVLEVPYGEDVGHAEGMTFFSPDGGPARSLLVVYDSVPKNRQPKKHVITADVFPLSGKSKPRRVY
jgi:Protein of unknown function (DUF3616)